MTMIRFHTRLVICMAVVLVTDNFFGASLTSADDVDVSSGVNGPRPEDAFAAIGGDGYVPMYLRRIAPSAIVADGQVYCAFQNSRGQPIVMVWHAESRTWSVPVTASPGGLGRDMHGSPAILADADGHLHLFFGCHRGPLRHVRSQRPWNIEHWEDLAPPAPKATYPQVFRMADDSLFLFFRAGGHPEPWMQMVSRDNGTTWSAPRRLIEMRLHPRHADACAYARFFPGRRGKSIHCFFNYKEDDKTRWPKQFSHLNEPVFRFNIYYVRGDLGGDWHNSENVRVDLPLSKSRSDASCMVYNSGDIFAYPGSYAADSQNRPYLVFRTGVLDWDKGGPDQVFRASTQQLNASAAPLVPIREKYLTWRDDGWRVNDQIPADWPRDVVSVLTGPGETVCEVTRHGIGLDYDDPYFLFFRRHPQPTSLFLFQSQSGKFARRSGGAAMLP